MKYLISFVFLFLLNCSGYTVASLSTNVVTVATTGKTNADLVVSYLAGKDCKFSRVTINREVCIQSDSNMAIKEETIEKKNKSDRKIVGRMIDTTYYITKNVAKDHAVLGAKIFDKIGLTNELEEKVKLKFENTEIEENLLQKPENNTKEKTRILKNDNSNVKNDGTTWKQRVEKVKVQKNELVEEVKVQKNELVEEAKIQKNELVEEVKVQKNELVEEVKAQSKTLIEEVKTQSKTLIKEAKVQKNELVEEAREKSKTLIEEAKIQKNELVEEAREKSKTLIEEAKVQKNELVEEAREKSNELKESFLKNIKKFKLNSPDTYSLNIDK